MRESIPPLPYPADALGSILEPMAIAVKKATEAPVALCGNSLLAAAALAVQPYADVMIDGRVFPVSIFAGTVAESGERKSTVDKYCLAPIRSHEKELWRKYR